jgi:hypothetical protein
MSAIPWMTVLTSEALRSNGTRVLRARRLSCLLTRRLHVLRYVQRTEEKYPCGFRPPALHREQLDMAIRCSEAAIAALTRISSEPFTETEGIID